MTSPIVIQQPGIGQQAAQSLQPLLQALQFNRIRSQQDEQLAIQRSQLEQQARNQMQSRVADFLLAGLQADSNFAKTDTAQQLEKMVPELKGFSAAIGESKARSARQEATAFERMFASATETEEAGVFANLSGETQQFLRARFALTQRKVQITGEIENRLAESFGVPQTEREKITLELQKLERADRIKKAEVFTRRKNIGNQINVGVEGLGLEQEEARTFARSGVDLIGMFEKAQASLKGGPNKTTQAKTILDEALKLMAATSGDFTRQAAMIPGTAWEQARSFLAQVDPSFNDIELSGEAAFQVQAMRDVSAVVRAFRENGNKLLIDGQLKKFNDRKAEERIREDLLSRLDPTQRIQILSVIDDILRLSFEAAAER